MARRAATAHRVDFAARLLLKGHSASRVVAELAEREGISLRSARRYVSQGYERIMADIEEAQVDRREIVAQSIHMLQEGAARALNTNHIAAMVGCLRELRELINPGSHRA